jgi:cation-transporting P-type ATPase E
MVTNLRGLSVSEVLERRTKGLGNNVKIKTSRSYFEILRENVFTFINNILFVLGAALILLGRTSDAVVSVGIILINVVVSVVQEIRAKRMLDRIALLTRPQATSIRDGKEQTLDPSEIVVGDVLSLHPGDQIVVDGEVKEGTIEVDESLLTGESDLIPKTPGDQVLSGSFCVTGAAYYEACKVGNESFANKLTSQARAFRRVLTPIQQQINLVIRILLIIAVYFEFILLIDTLITHVSLVDSVKVSVVVAGLVPNGLFVAIALSYALGAVRIAGKGALVQQSNAVESLSNVNLLCLDKTGTLTANQIRFDSLFALETSEEELRRLLGDFTASGASGNRTSEAIAAACPGSHRTAVEEVPFSSERKWSALSFNDTDRKGSFVLGALEMLATSLQPGSHFEDQAKTWAEQGLRVLLFAYRREVLPLYDNERHPVLPENLIPLGLISLSDVLRPEVNKTLAAFAGTGVKLKIISGDNPQTVAALARQAGMGPELVTISGLQLDEMNPAEFAEAAENSTIFGRIAPHQKEQLIQALRNHGHYVAMIGDGVNDVLSLKQANLGIAMQSGSQAARSVADIVLLGDSFACLPFAVQEGQRIINGMQDILRLFLSRTFYVTLIILSTSILGGFPFSPKQSSVLALLVVGLPTLLLAAWARPGPGPKGSPERRMLHFVLPASLTMSVFGLMVFAGFLLFGIQEYLVTHPLLDAQDVLGIVLPAAQTALVSFSILSGLLLLVFVEPPTHFWAGGDEFSGDRRPAFLALGLMVGYVVFLAMPSLRSFFDFAPISIFGHLVIAAAAVVWMFVIRWTWRSKLVERFFSLDLQV